MTDRNFIPRSSNSGSIGTASKRWPRAWVIDADVGGDLLVSGSITGSVGNGIAFGETYYDGIFPVSGSSSGFNIYTPSNSNTAYFLIISGKNSPSTRVFIDIISFFNIGTWTPRIISSTTLLGSPGTRTYSNSGGALRIALSGGSMTYYINIAVMQLG